MTNKLSHSALIKKCACCNVDVVAEEVMHIDGVSGHRYIALAWRCKYPWCQSNWEVFEDLDLFCLRHSVHASTVREMLPTSASSLQSEVEAQRKRLAEYRATQDELRQKLTTAELEQKCAQNELKATRRVIADLILERQRQQFAKVGVQVFGQEIWLQNASEYETLNVKTALLQMMAPWVRWHPTKPPEIVDETRKCYAEPPRQAPREAKGTVLEEAAKIVEGARRESYGDPKTNHERTASMFAAYLGTPVTARQVCMLNVLQKVSRDAHQQQRDNLVDIAGYVRNIELTEDKS